MVDTEADALDALRRGRPLEGLAERGWWRALAAQRSLEAHGKCVGSWQIGEQLGVGGTGSVHAATHASGTLSAAIKILRSPLDPAALHREARIIAGLSHPSIVRLIDAGSADDGPWSPGAGMPWIAMERAPGGPLTPLCGMLPWSEVKQILVAILDALAHAHARDVLHLDLKPDNVLVLRTSTGPRLKLADFGLSTLGASPHGPIAGTPAYMAPEQWRGDRDQFGPSTDLYALGCLVTALVRGASPFKGDTAAQRTAHLATPPNVTPGIAAPEKLPQWIRRAMAKHPSDRFPSAAHARAALEVLGPISSAAATSRAEPTASATLYLDDLTPLPDAVPDTAEALPIPILTLPEQPRRGEPLPPVPPPGTAFWGASRPPIDGRQSEQGQLWEALITTVKTRQPLRVGITGLAGAGSRGLAKWFVQRVREEGACRVFRLPIVQPHEDPLRTALITAARLEMKAPSTHLQRVCRWLDLRWDDPIGAICVAAAAGTNDAAEAWQQVLRREAARQPVVVLVEDRRAAQAIQEMWSSLAGPLLALVVHPASPVDVEVVLSRLPIDTVRTLLERSARLDPVLAAQIAHHTGGLPGYALAIVDNMVGVSALVDGPRGLSRLPEVALRLPKDAAAVWDQRIQSAVRTANDQSALERAALMGLVVDVPEFEGATPDIDPSLPLRAATAGLGGMEAEGLWRFAPAARERLLTNAQEGGRTRDHHRAIAAAISGDEPGRRAVHLIQAGLEREAMPDLLADATGQLRRGDPQLAASSIGQWDELAESLGVSAADPARPGQALLAAQIYEATRQPDRARNTAIAGLEYAVDAERVGLLIALARACGTLNDYALSAQHNEEALQIARRLDEPALVADALWNLSFALRFLGRAADSAAHLVASCESWASCGTAHGDAMAARGQASLALSTRDALAGAKAYEQAAEAFEAADQPIDARKCAYLACNAYRWCGELELAWPLALASVSAAPSNQRRSYTLTLAGLAWAMGKRELARREYDLTMLRFPGDGELALCTRLLLQSTTASEAELGALVDEALEGEQIGGHHLADLAWHFNETARGCIEVGHTALAARLTAESARLAAAWVTGA